MVNITTSRGIVSDDNVKIYLVGGAVRDLLLNKTPKDNDFVIVGADSSFARRLQSIGFEQVGADFPVYLHPDTKEEFAFARQERKVGKGYAGFESITSPELTIEDDLIRRDLTVNSMAIDLENDQLIDPFNGQLDLQNGIIRHTSDAFSEDPLRVLRVARFIARYNFTVAPETEILIEDLVKSGDLKHLVQERVSVEFEKIFSEKHADRALSFMQTRGVLNSIHPKFNDIDEDDMRVFKNVIVGKAIHSIKFAAIGHRFSISDLKFLRVSSYTEKLTLLYAKIKNDLSVWKSLDKSHRRDLLLSMKVLQRDVTFFDNILELCHANGYSFTVIDAFVRDVNALRTVDNAALLMNVKDKDIGAVIKEKHLSVLGD